MKFIYALFLIFCLGICKSQETDKTFRTEGTHAGFTKTSIKTEAGTLVGYRRQFGEELVKPRYMNSTLFTSEGVAIVFKSGFGPGLLDTTGTEVIPPNDLNDLTFLTPNHLIAHRKDTLFFFSKEGTLNNAVSGISRKNYVTNFTNGTVRTKEYPPRYLSSDGSPASEVDFGPQLTYLNLYDYLVKKSPLPEGHGLVGIYSMTHYGTATRSSYTIKEFNYRFALISYNSYYYGYFINGEKLLDPIFKWKIEDSDFLKAEINMNPDYPFVIPEFNKAELRLEGDSLTLDIELREFVHFHGSPDKFDTKFKGIKLRESDPIIPTPIFARNGTNPYLFVSHDGLGVKNRSNEVIIPANYQEIWVVWDRDWFLVREKDNGYRFIHKSGETKPLNKENAAKTRAALDQVGGYTVYQPEVGTSSFLIEEGHLLPALKPGQKVVKRRWPDSLSHLKTVFDQLEYKTHLIDLGQKRIIRTLPYLVKYIKKGKVEYFQTQTKNGFGMLSTQWKEIIPAKMGKPEIISDRKNSRYFVRAKEASGMYRYFNMNGDPVTINLSEWIHFFNGTYAVEKTDQGFFLYDNNFKRLNDAPYVDYQDKLCYIGSDTWGHLATFKQGSKVGVIDQQGNILKSARYDEVKIIGGSESPFAFFRKKKKGWIEYLFTGEVIVKNVTNILLDPPEPDGILVATGYSSEDLAFKRRTRILAVLKTDNKPTYIIGNGNLANFDLTTSRLTIQQLKELGINPATN